MISKSPKEIYQTTSKNLQDKGLNVDEETVKKFNTFLFGKINSMLMSFQHLELYVPQLGVWKFRRKKAEECVRRSEHSPVHKAMLALHGDEELAKSAANVQAERIGKIKRLIESHEKMIVEKLAFKKFRDEHSTVQRSVEEQKQDIRGVEEQTL